MTRADLISCAEQAVREMCADRGLVVREYAGGYLISGRRFCLPVQHLAYVTAEQLDRPWIDEDEDCYREEIEINGARFYV